MLNPFGDVDGDVTLRYDRGNVDDIVAYVLPLVLALTLALALPCGLRMGSFKYIGLSFVVLPLPLPPAVRLLMLILGSPADSNDPDPPDADKGDLGRPPEALVAERGRRSGGVAGLAGFDLTCAEDGRGLLWIRWYSRSAIRT